MSRSAIERENTLLEGPAGPLEAVLEYPRGTEPGAVAVVCHPHPVYGGTLNNKVAFTLARAAVESGAAALRFNFRGVGKSAGEFDHGLGEAKDLEAAERWLAGRWPGLPVWRMGFSFGAAMALKRTAVTPCGILVTVAPPAGRFADYGFDASAPQAGRWLLVQGDADEVVDSGAVLAWARSLARPPRIEVVEGAGHFFHGNLTVLRKRVVSFLEKVNDGNPTEDD